MAQTALYRVLAAPLLAAVLAGLGPAGAATATKPCESWAGTQPLSPGTADNGLSAVTVLSACNAWMVGAAGDSSGNQALIEHWNGATWTVTPIPALGSDGLPLLLTSPCRTGRPWGLGTTTP